MDDLEEEVVSENEDNQSIQSSNSSTNDEIISDDEELDEEIKLDEPESDDKINVFDNPKSSYTKYDYEVEDLGENDFYKFNNELKKNHTLNYHNECLYKNFNEIKELSKITRNKYGIIVDELHKTIPLLTKYEKTKILGMRVKQLNSGSNPYVTNNEKIIDNYLIAQMELEQKKLPFIIQRPLPNNNFEYWKLQDLDIL
jgi:DNA-directed RNA polymerase subunit K/omega